MVKYHQLFYVYIKIQNFLYDATDCNGIAANTQRNKYVIITSKRRFDVIITCLLRFLFTRW